MGSGSARAAGYEPVESTPSLWESPWALGAVVFFVAAAIVCVVLAVRFARRGREERRTAWLCAGGALVALLLAPIAAQLSGAQTAEDPEALHRNIEARYAVTVLEETLSAPGEDGQEQRVRVQPEDGGDELVYTVVTDPDTHEPTLTTSTGTSSADPDDLLR